MPRELSFDLLRLDVAVREALLQSRDRYLLTDAIVEELAWAAFYRNWDGAMVEAWAAAKSSNSDRLEIPKGPVSKAPSIDPLSPWAFAELGLRSGILPGGGVLDERGWGAIDGETVSLETYSREARKLLREHAAARPNGTLARELARLEAERRRARLVVARTSRPTRGRAVPKRRAVHRARNGRSRRVRRANVGGGKRIGGGGADPPEPPAPRPKRQPFLDRGRRENRGRAGRSGGAL